MAVDWTIALLRALQPVAGRITERMTTGEADELLRRLKESPYASRSRAERFYTELMKLPTVEEQEKFLREEGWKLEPEEYDWVVHLWERQKPKLLGRKVRFEEQVGEVKPLAEAIAEAYEEKALSSLPPEKVIYAPRTLQEQLELLPENLRARAGTLSTQSPRARQKAYQALSTVLEPAILAQFKQVTEELAEKAQPTPYERPKPEIPVAREIPPKKGLGEEMAFKLEEPVLAAPEVARWKEMEVRPEDVRATVRRRAVEIAQEYPSMAERKAAFLREKDIYTPEEQAYIYQYITSVPAVEGEYPTEWERMGELMGVSPKEAKARLAPTEVTIEDIREAEKYAKEVMSQPANIWEEIKRAWGRFWGPKQELMDFVIVDKDRGITLTDYIRELKEQGYTDEEINDIIDIRAKAFNIMLKE